MPAMSRSFRLLTLAVPLLVLGACGDDDSASAEATAAADDGSITIVADDLAFDPDTVSAPAGELGITLDNRDDGVPHNIVVTGNGVDAGTELEKGPVTQELTVDLPSPGDYTFVCEIHPAMKGTIRVS